MNQALLVIDAQQELIEGNESDSSVFKKEELLNNINLVIDKAKESDALVVFVRDKDVAGGKGEGFQVHQKINVPSSSKIFDKKATNSFYGTPLLEYLKEHEIEHLVIMGCQTEYCIDSAVRTATISGFDVTLAADGHSTKDSTVLTAVQIIDHHNKTLHGHYNVDNFAVVRKSEENLFEPIHNNYR
ncbi:cysteine hydrolase [Bacillus sp. EB106-08-02-XG196]|uniref:cysteine hydrolase family protein n=1 Tax=Bacillus sp. EB106-08-02-XG196 TaxID=2737049 RepID=UPI0015C4A3BB|nr:cysteine hydrolase [Bacillus sp. EB106-08-02-XG196]